MRFCCVELTGGHIDHSVRIGLINFLFWPLIVFDTALAIDNALMRVEKGRCVIHSSGTLVLDGSWSHLCERGFLARFCHEDACASNGGGAISCLILAPSEPTPAGSDPQLKNGSQFRRCLRPGPLGSFDLQRHSEPLFWPPAVSIRRCQTLSERVNFTGAVKKRVNFRAAAPECVDSLVVQSKNASIRAWPLLSRCSMNGSPFLRREVGSVRHDRLRDEGCHLRSDDDIGNTA